ncbi:hypothetical protein [Pseudarthrobacter enclensis]|uniref:PE-PPE domain-containing protein n=1 Tax=Pseudarthrobacter enclensis TaxID=993070 RepID=A0ABT9RWT4_9MICC|nr:hypothetical protein [Pseudarthrobacter enclensis]MDP9889210.1 hypothetical protein [Pseudarthrobacter enclensis]
MSAAPPPGDGGIRLYGPSRDGSLSVRGGTSGISVQLEELTAGAEKLEWLAQDLLRAEEEAGRILDELCRVDHQAAWSDVGHVASVRDSGWALRTVRTEMQRISAGVRSCILDYENAEDRAAAGRFFGYRSPPELLRSALVILASKAADGQTVEWLVNQLGARASVMKANIARNPWVRDAVFGLASGFRPRHIGVQREDEVAVELEASPSGLLARIRQIEARGPGFMEVLEVPNGAETAYVVIIPGTEPAGIQAGGSNPFDEAGIAEGMLYGSSEVNAAVLEALEAAGAKQGAPVVAVGYSQGGIHAMNLAADPRFLRTYDVRYVLTAGSPVGGITPGTGVSSLHLEHEADWVPGADGAPNPDARDTVTVTMTNPVTTPDGEDAGLGPGHRLGGYEEAARQVGLSKDPSLVQSTAALGAVLGAGGAVTATRFSLSRTPPPPAPKDRRDPFSGRPQPGAR